jgi:hypothetical protein
MGGAVASVMPLFWVHARYGVDRRFETLTDSEFRVLFRLWCLSAEESPRFCIDARNRRMLALQVADGDEGLLARVLDRICDFEHAALDDDVLTMTELQAQQYKKPSDCPQATASRKAAERARRAVTPCHALSHQEEKEKREEKREQTPPLVPPGGDDAAVSDPPTPPADEVPAGATTRGARRTTRRRPVGDDGYSVEFEAFWVIYPRTRLMSKRRAYKCWQALVADGVAALGLVKSAEHFAAYCRAERLPEDRIKHPSTFLSWEGRDYEPWVDETAAAAGVAGGRAGADRRAGSAISRRETLVDGRISDDDAARKNAESLAALDRVIDGFAAGG